jgi:hypothetical protein
MITLSIPGLTTIIGISRFGWADQRYFWVGIITSRDRCVTPAAVG